MEQAVRPTRLLRFGVYEIDFDAGELRRDGRKVALQEQPFQVLVLLLASPGKLVTREELQKRLWPADTFVDFDLGLNTAIKKIRAALGDAADNPRFVETLPRRGYRFICPVEEVTPAGPLPAGNGSQSNIQVGRKEMASPQAVPGPSAQGNLMVSDRPAQFRPWLALGSVAVVLLLAGLTFNGLRHAEKPKSAGTPMQSIDLERLEDRGTQNSVAYDSYSRGEDLLRAYDMPERLDNAIQAFKEAIQADRGFALAYADLGIIYGAKYSTQPQDKWADLALENCNQALALDAAGPAGRICQGTLRNAMGEYDRALEDFSTAIASDSRSANAYRARAYRGRAFANQQRNKKTEAEADYGRAIELEPHYWRSYTSLAQLYKIEDRYEDAIKQYELASKETPDNSELLFSLGGVYLDAGYYDKAVAVLDEALKAHPSAEIYENLGTGRLNQGRFEDAIKNFKAAADLDPDNYLYRGALARAFFWAPGDQRAAAQEQYEKAIVLAKQKLKVNLEDPAVNLMLAVFYAMSAQKDEALSHLRHARKLKPDWGELAFWTAIVHLQMENNRTKALFWLRQARALGYSAAQINAAPELESLSTDPEFRRLMLAGGKSKSLSSKTETDGRTK